MKPGSAAVAVEKRSVEKSSCRGLPRDVPRFRMLARVCSPNLALFSSTFQGIKGPHSQNGALYLIELFNLLYNCTIAASAGGLWIAYPMFEANRDGKDLKAINTLDRYSCREISSQEAGAPCTVCTIEQF